MTSAGIFLAGTNYPSGAFPMAVAIEDFNNDGVSDIASANETGKNVSVFLNQGDGTFGSAHSFAVGEGAVEIGSADLNRDGNADLVVTDGIKSAYVSLGHGDGTFGPATKIGLDTDPFGIAIADQNGDGILDLAIAIFGREDQNQGKVAILIGAGDGTFAAPVFYSLAHRAVRLVATDLNHDGKLDLAVTLGHFPDPNNALAVLLGNGDGTFQAAVFSVTGSADDVAAADLNADGNIDLALAGDGDVRVLLGKGDGTFQPAITNSVEGVTDTIAIADLNRDRVPDLLVGGSHTVTFLGNGDGTFSPPVTYGIGQHFTRIGYFNPDRDPDVVAGGVSEIIVALGKKDGTLRAPVAYDFKPVGFDSADFDGDGHADLVVSSLSSDPFLFLRGLGDGTFAPGVPIGDVSAFYVYAADLNRDGKLDLVLSGGAGINIRLGNGDGTFQTAQFAPLSFTSDASTVGDFNKDGRLDLVATAGVYDDQFAILLGKGDSTFEAATNYQTSATYVLSPQVADFNDDGNLDLAICVSVSNTVSIYLGNGDGTFASPLSVATIAPLYSAVGDLNRDSKIDLLVTGGTGDTSLKLFLGNGDGTFQAPQTIYSDYGPIRVADLDRDGRVDIAFAPQLANRGLVVLRGRGDGTIESVSELPTGQWYNGTFVLSDLNGDKRPEIIVGAGVYTDLAVLLNTSHPRR